MRNLTIMLFSAQDDLEFSWHLLSQDCIVFLPEYKTFRLEMDLYQGHLETHFLQNLHILPQQKTGI
ncbi:hypothetical protein EB444_23820 [Salmonella enterica]|nr:hypothetical protein [Salmonella enterica]